MDLSLLLGMAAEGMPSRAAVETDGGRLTYADLLDRSERVASWLLDRGAPTAALLDVNSEVVPLLAFGASIAGIPFAPLNYRLADDRLGAIACQLAPAVLVVADDAVDRLSVDGIDVVAHSRFLAEACAAEPMKERRAAPEDVAILLFTSGTSGSPKRAILRQRHLTSYVLSTVEFMGAEDGDAALVSVPPYHIAGISAILSSVYAGRRLVYLPSFDPAAWVRTVAASSITNAMVVPTMLKRILDVMVDTGAELPSLRHLSYGGGRMPLPVIEEALTRLPHVDFVNAYGLTETSSTVTLLDPDDHRAAHAADDPVVARRLGSVGRPLPGVELEIRDEYGERVGPGVRGEVWVRGEQVSGEYADRADGSGGGGGWFDTKDVGWVDDAGFLFLEGRADDVIVRGGENLSPGEIEDVLTAHPDIAEAAIVGMPSVEWGQVPVAVIVPGARRPSEQEVAEWVRGHLRSSRVPERVLFTDKLPYTDTGKLLRRLIRDELLTSSPR